MARVNLERRAEIGLEKRGRTRTAILDAARRLYAAPTAAPVTVDAVMQAAALAKGTFYVHFRDLAELETELGASLIEELDKRLQPARLAADQPLTRLATAVTVLLRDLASAPPEARLVAHAVAAIPEVGHAMVVHLWTDLADAHAGGLLALSSVELAAHIVTALCRQAAADLGAGRIDERAVPEIVEAVLRAVGCTPKVAALHADKATRHARALPPQMRAKDSQRSRGENP